MSQGGGCRPTVAELAASSTHNSRKLGPSLYGGSVKAHRETSCGTFCSSSLFLSALGPSAWPEWCVREYLSILCLPPSSLFLRFFQPRLHIIFGSVYGRSSRASRVLSHVVFISSSSSSPLRCPVLSRPRRRATKLETRTT